LQANGAQKQAGITILVCDKAYFKPKLVRRDKERSLYFDKWNHPSRRYNNYKHIFTEHQHTQFP
jgi:hypothetical protein